MSDESDYEFNEYDRDDDKDEYDYYKEEIDYMGAERKAFERVSTGRHDDLLTRLFPEGFGGKEARRLDAINRRLFRLTITPEEKFKLMINIFFNTYNETLKLGNNDLDRLTTLDDVKNAGYKNPIAWIFGYYVVLDKKIIKKRLETIKGLLSDIEEVGLEDVIRYARYWLQNK